MKTFVFTALFLIAGLHHVKGQEMATKTRPTFHPVLTAGICSSNSRDNWAYFRTGAELGRNRVLIGVHRLLKYYNYRSQLYQSREFRPWPVGLNLSYRRYLSGITSRFAPFLWAGLMVSRSDWWQYSNSSPDPEFIGAWWYLEPTVGCGFSWHFSEFVSLGVEAGLGLDIGQYFPKGEKAWNGYWPAGFTGILSLEKRF